MRNITFFICFGFIFLLVACNDSEQEVKEAIPTPIEVSNIEIGDFVVGKTVYGKTAPSKQHPVMLEQPGKVKTLNVKNGDKVSEGDHLATIETPMGNQELYATIDGKIGQLGAAEGEFQSNEEPLLLVIDVDSLFIHYAVTAEARALFTVDEKMDIVIEENTYQATVTSIDSIPNEAGQYAIMLQVANKDENILPGTPAEVKLQDKRIQDTIIVPTEAILTEEDEQFVFVLQEDYVEKVIVDVQETQTDQSAVKADLKEDDQVVVNGHFTLTDQDKVTVTKEGKAS